MDILETIEQLLDPRLARHEALLVNILYTIEYRTKIIMTDITTLQASADALRAEADTNSNLAKKALQAIGDLSGQIAQLKSQAAPVTAAQLDALQATLIGATAELKATDTALTTATETSTSTHTATATI